MLLYRIPLEVVGVVDMLLIGHVKSTRKTVSFYSEFSNQVKVWEFILDEYVFRGHSAADHPGLPLKSLKRRLTS